MDTIVNTLSFLPHRAENQRYCVAMPSQPMTTRAGRKTKTLLLTVLGSAVAPRNLTLWQETYVRALADLGASEAAARQTIARAVSAGWLASTREGRRSRLSVPGKHREGLDEGARRVERFGTQPPWSGEWLVLILTVPEQARALRHRFRTQLGWLGFGSLGNGVWISPHVDSEDEIRALLSSAEGIGDSHLFRSATYADARPQRLANAAWDIGSLRDRYDAFVTRFTASQPHTGPEVWSEWVELVTSWRHFPLFDPELPDHLLPPNWPRDHARELFESRNTLWLPGAFAHLEDIERSVVP